MLKNPRAGLVIDLPLIGDPKPTLREVVQIAKRINRDLGITMLAKMNLLLGIAAIKEDLSGDADVRWKTQERLIVDTVSERRLNQRMAAIKLVALFGDPRLLILAPRGDEADRWLRWWDKAAHVPFVVTGVLVALLEGLSRSKLYVQLDEISVLGVDGWTLAGGFLAVCLLSSAGLMFSGVVNWPAYWREPLRSHLFVDTHTSQTPRWTGAAPHVPHVFDLSRPSRKHLRHSAICADAAVASATLAWIRTGARPDAQSTAPIGINAVMG